MFVQLTDSDSKYQITSTTKKHQKNIKRRKNVYDIFQKNACPIGKFMAGFLENTNEDSQLKFLVFQSATLLETNSALGIPQERLP